MKAATKPDPYDVLGVDKNATPGDIKKAHRKRIRKAHPDSGGNPEEFMALQCAYETLIDPEKRRRYDNNEPEPGSIVQEALGHLCKIFNSLLDSHGDKITTIDIVSAITGHIRGDIVNITAMKNSHAKKAKTLRKVLERLKYSGRRVDVLKEMLEQQLQDIARGQKQADRTIEMLEMATILAKEYAFERESPITSDFARDALLQTIPGSRTFTWNRN
ncbi:MAG: J domain-containing protein [Oryzomonas sp.]